MSTAAAALADLRKLADPEDAAFLQRFFKTGPGEYGAGDVFLGIRVPATRRIAKKYHDLPLAEVRKLLRAQEHEARLLAVIILTMQYGKASEAQRAKIFDLYLANTRYINNWDIIDVSAPRIVGAHLFNGGDAGLLDELAQSKSLWERRIAILATAYFIGQDEFRPTLRIAQKLLRDEHDLIHKASGWMLREVGKRDREALTSFLERHARAMPRTMLRYALEKFSAGDRARFMVR
ncbi:MAG TPA: DNA alkylation repair protein [Longimicrobiales bacterium]